MVTEGQKFESRLHRLLYWEGHFARTSVNLSDYFHPEKIDVTDLDVIAVDLSRPSRLAVVIAECKTGDHAKAADRMIWLRGLQEYFEADEAVYAAVRIPPKMKEFAQVLKLRAINGERLTEREAELGIGESDWFGSFDPFFRARLLGLVRNELKQEREFQRLFWFITADYWYTDNYVRIKRLISAIGYLGERWVESTEDFRTSAYRWILGEACILLSLALLDLAASVYEMTEQEARDVIALKMSAGIARADELHKLARRVNEYVQATVLETQGPEALARVPNFDIRPPDYTPGLIDLVMRIRANHGALMNVPRYLDLRVYGSWLRSNSDSAAGIDRFGFDIPAMDKQVENLVRFLTRSTNLDRIHFEKLMNAGAVQFPVEAKKPFEAKKQSQPRRKTRERTPTKNQLDLGAAPNALPDQEESVPTEEGQSGDDLTRPV